jgi:large subunit ribosomal protein L5
MMSPEEENKTEDTPAEDQPASSPQAEDKPDEKPAEEPSEVKAEDKAEAEPAKAEEKPEADEAKPRKEAKPAAEKKEKAAKKEKKTQKEPDQKAKKEKKKGKEPVGDTKVPADYLPRLLKMYRDQIMSELTKRFGYKNSMMIPRLDKIILNVGIGEGAQNPKLLESATQELASITAQKPVITRARKSISNFKLRAGMSVGCRVTLRGWRMWEFLDRLMAVAIPRIRDFRGLSDRSFDGRGNYTFGIREQIIFPEIDIDKIERVHGMDITFVTSARTDEEAHALLECMGWPFRRRAQSTEQAA